MNPFIITGSIPPEYFCDRREESVKIIKGIAGGKNFCLLSPRRLGKSKLVKYCYADKELVQKYYTFYIDILHTKSLKEFTFYFGQAVFNQLYSQSRKMLSAFVQGLKSINAKFGFDPLTSMPAFTLELGEISQRHDGIHFVPGPNDRLRCLLSGSKYFSHFSLFPANVSSYDQALYS